MHATRRSRRLLIPILAMAFPGCTEQVVSPWHDVAADKRADLTTPSAEGFKPGFGAETSAAGPARTASFAGDASMPADGAPGRGEREWERSTVYYHQIAVTHWPVYFENPFVDKGNQATDPADRDAPDSRFESEAVDDLAAIYGHARFLLNIVGWPVSAIVTPPGAIMASDGRLSEGLLGYDHDAARASRNTENPERIDQQRPTADTVSAPLQTSPGPSGATPTTEVSSPTAPTSSPANAPPAAANPPSADVLVLPAK